MDKRIDARAWLFPSRQNLNVNKKLKYATIYFILIRLHIMNLHPPPTNVVYNSFDDQVQ